MAAWGSPPDPTTVAATVETPALFDDEAGGNANGDDPAVWVDRRHPERSLVVATKKEGGLDVYNLAGRRVQEISATAIKGAGPDDEPARFNNVDVVQGARLGHSHRRSDIAIVTDRGSDVIRVYEIKGHSRQPLREITAPDAPWAFSSSQDEVNEQTSAYGVASYLDPRSGSVLVAASRRHTPEIGLFRLVRTHDGVSYAKVRTITLPDAFTLPDGSSWSACVDPGEGPQVEGMVIDRDSGVLYAAQEDVGVWEIPLRSAGEPRLIEKVKEFGVPYSYDLDEEECIIDYASDPGFGGEHIAADAEGLTIYYAGRRGGYLLVSSQGDSSFAAFQRGGDHAFLGQFQVSLGDDVVEHSDGSLVVNVPLGHRFPQGVFITHDGNDTPLTYDENGEPRERTNFKFTPWQRIAGELGLVVDTRG
jgi:3-phytase